MPRRPEDPRATLVSEAAKAVSETPPTLTLTLDAADATPPATASPGYAGLPSRYRRLGHLGAGGMGVVERVLDMHLGCTLALKTLSLSLVDSVHAQQRFDAEVRVTAHLRHPGIVAVQDAGRLDDGRLWYTMTEVGGRTLSDALHDGLSLARAVDIVARVAETMAYAHSQGVIHRDLKPANLMVGEFGEVMVMDWGLARVVGEPHIADPDEPTLASDGMTRDGDVMGTPTYMSPEQARGELDAMGPPSDVFSLGAVLYRVISGRHIDTGTPHEVAFRRALGGPELSTPVGVPEDLMAICRTAMSSQAQDRFDDASGFAQALRRWLEGAEKHAKALVILEQAASRRPEIDRLRAEARHKRHQAAAILAPLMPHSPTEHKEPAWDLEEEASVADKEAVVREVAWRQLVGAALELVPELPEAHEALADHYAERLRLAEEAGQREEVARSEALLVAHDRGRFQRLLAGVGAVTLVTDPPDAEVRLYEYVERRRRLLLEPRGTLGRTPLVEVPLARGSWLLTLHAPGREVVRYPVFLERGGAWSGVRPGDSEPWVIELPEAGTLAPDDCYVPAGWFRAGGDDAAVDSMARTMVWVDAFVISRFSVTNEAFLPFLTSGASGESVKEHQEAGIVDRDGAPGLVEGRESWPLHGITWSEADRYARWRGHRLPHELEWEKAARGVDGRVFACGDWVEPTWAAIMGGRERPRPQRVQAFPLDESPYGVRGTVGGIRNRCRNAWARGGAQLVGGCLELGHDDATESSEYTSSRGGSWASTASLSRAATRFADPPLARHSTLGLRLARGWAS